MSQALLQPVLLGGLFMGVLSALPIISFGNCCCLWVTGGGVVTAYLIQHGREDSVQLGEGAFGGFLSGIVGAVVYALVALPVQFVMAPLQRGMLNRFLESAAEFPPELRQFFEGVDGGFGSILIGLMVMFPIMLVLGAVFSTLGGLIGTLIFRSAPPAAPAAPTPPELPA